METDSRDLLALIRTILANERTLLAYTRTALGLLLGGLGLVKFLTHPLLVTLGWLLIVSGVILAGVGVGRFHHSRSHFGHLRLKKPESNGKNIHH